MSLTNLLFFLQKTADAVISIKDYEKLTATRTLFSELKKGEESALKSGWLDTQDVRKMLGL